MLSPLSYSHIFSRAWPIILANAAVPLLGIVDTAIIGNTGNAQELGAIALGALIFNFVYWSFGFLRMGTTGFTAQAAGANHWLEVRLVLGRALLIALILAVLLIVIHRLLGWSIMQLFQASQAVEEETTRYFNIRIWGAPATLGTFALLGTLVGLGKSKHLLITQLFLNGLNIVLDIYFAAILGWGVEGIAWGTMLAEYATLLFALAVVYRVLIQNRTQTEPFWNWNQIVEKSALIKMLGANGDIMIRTIFLVLAFAWFTNEGAKFGDTTLAANHILLQFISFSAFFLDGYAFVAESIVGTGIGARNLSYLRLGIWRSSVLGVATAFILSIGTYLMGDLLISNLTDLQAVRDSASQFLSLACIYILFSIAAFQLDGIFIGAVRSAEMRNAAIISTLIFLYSCEKLTQTFNNSGLWMAFIVYVVVRAVTLLVYYPRIGKTIVATTGE